MTRHVWTSVTCDHAGCKDVVTDLDRQARQIAKRAGWVLAQRAGHRVDLCPAHKHRTGSES